MAVERHEQTRSIGTKLLFSHLLQCVVIILLGALVSWFLTTRYIRESRKTELLEKAGRIAESSRQMPEGEYVPDMHVLRTYANLSDAEVFFLEEENGSIRLSRYRTSDPPDRAEPNSDASSLHKPPDKADALKAREGEARSDLQWEEVKNPIDREFLSRVLAGEKVSAMRYSLFAQGEALFAGAPIVDEAGVVRSGVILARPVKRFRGVSRAAGYLIILVMCISFLMSVVLSTQLSRVLVSPIKRITLAARHMENGLYAERITKLPSDEIGELGHALNSMSARLIDVIGNLRMERDRINTFISHMSEGLVTVNSQWGINRVNKAFYEMMELDRAERLLEEEGFFTPLVAAIRRCMDSGEAESLEFENPSHRMLQATVTAQRNEEGEVEVVVCMIRDVSEVQRMEQLRRDYVANVSHELRTPLTGIRGMVEPLIDGCYETEEERQECYRIILKETIRLEKLVGEMLDMSRLQDGRVKVELEPLELPGILDAACRSMKHIADERCINLAVETDGTKLACMGNEDRITQVLLILIDNALSFTPRGGSVTVFGRDGGDVVYAGVRDTGFGIDPKDLPLIFERFYKVDKSRMGTEGTGLGLSIAKLLTQLMGGDITVMSEVGVGSVFTFTLRKQ